jgi:hypothetical protein
LVGLKNPGHIYLTTVIQTHGKPALQSAQAILFKNEQKNFLQTRSQAKRQNRPVERHGR